MPETRSDDGRPVDQAHVRDAARDLGLRLDGGAVEACPHGDDPHCPSYLLDAAQHVVDVAGRPLP